MNKTSKRAAAVLLTAACSAPALAQASDSKTTVNLDLSAAVYAGNREVSGDFEDNNRSSLRGGALLSLDHDWGSNRISADAGTTLIEYLDGGQRDRWSNRVSLAYVRELVDDLRLSVGGGYSTQVIGLEHDKFNQSQLRSMLTYQPGDNRFRVGGGYRWRDYDDAGDTNGEGYFLDVDYRRRLGRDRYASLDVVYDRINADVRGRDYRRISVTPAYSFAVGKNTDIDLLLRWRRWSYDHRYYDGRRRVDHSLQPTVRLTHEFARDWTVEMEAAWRRRWSKDPDGEENGPRGMIGINKRIRVIR